MPSSRLERVKAQHGQLAGLLDQMEAYIREQSETGAPYVLPKLAAAMLGLSEGEAFVLLKVLAAGGLLEQVYNVYCGQHSALLNTISNLERIPYCEFCDAQHGPDEIEVEIAFRPTTEEKGALAA